MSAGGSFAGPNPSKKILVIFALAIVLLTLAVFLANRQKPEISQNTESNLSQEIQEPLKPENLSTFSSDKELQEFVKENIEGYPRINNVPYFFSGIRPMITRSLSLDSAGGTSVAGTGAGGSTAGADFGGSDAVSAADYSQTNIQVQGVDEADIVKNDGEYMYVLSKNRVIILEAFPPKQAKVIGKIDLKNSSA